MKNLIAIILLALLAACGTTAPSGQSSVEPTLAGSPATSTLPVVATYSILGDLVAQVGREKISLTTLVGAGSDAHTYEPSPGDSANLADAVVVFENGLAFEEWLDDLYTASGSSASRVVVTEGIAPLPAPEEGHHEGEEHAEEAASGTPEAEAHAEEEHGEYDPHVWHNPQNAIIMVERIRDGLVAADAANAEAYTANAAAYIAQLNELDAFVNTEIAKLPAEKRKLVTGHDTFGYFAERYGFELVGTALGAISTEVADPAAGELAELIEDIKAAGVPAIFAENISNTDVMETIAREAGVTLAPTLYTDALGEAGSDGDTYLKMVRYNVTTIVAALGQ
jgi:zinc/manganese transport system substrate-binding protein